MKEKLLQTCFFLTLFGLLLITPIGRVSANTEWNLQITNIANNTVNYSYNQILAMPQTTISANLYCLGSLVTSGEWEGVSLSYLLQQSGLDPIVASVNFVAQDGYTVSLQLQEALQSDVIVAYQLNGVALPETLRLVLPEENGAMWIAMITSINMSTATVLPGSGIGDTGMPLPNNSIGQSSTQQQEPLQTQHTTPKNETRTETAASPTNTTQPAQKASLQQRSNPDGNFPLMVVFGIAIGATVALVAGTLTLIRKRKIRIHSTSSQTVLST